MKRIKNGALPIVSTPYRIVGWIKRSGSANVGRLREASRQKTPPKAELAVMRIQTDCPSFPRSCVGMHTGA
nr:hypothetical protein [Methylomarinum sp. Ch1-1]MDP4521185.1 hypothetical protein [Methylomarinum sp. Ch1-1]